MNSTLCARSIVKNLELCDPESDPDDILDVKLIQFAVPDEKIVLSNIPQQTEMLCFPSVNNCYCLNDMTHCDVNENIKVLYCGHDGIISILNDDSDGNYLDIKISEEAEDEIVLNVLNKFPNLEEIHFCGYYSDIDLPIKRMCERLSKPIKFVEIF